MRRFKKLLASLLAVAMLASMGTVVMASEVFASVTNDIEQLALTRCPSCGSGITTYETPVSPPQYKTEQSGSTLYKYQLYSVKYSCTGCPFMSATTEWKWIGTAKSV